MKECALKAFTMRTKTSKDLGFFSSSQDYMQHIAVCAFRNKISQNYVQRRNLDYTASADAANCNHAVS
jgi:hypothetical protein